MEASVKKASELEASLESRTEIQVEPKRMLQKQSSRNQKFENAAA